MLLGIGPDVLRRYFSVRRGGSAPEMRVGGAGLGLHAGAKLLGFPVAWPAGESGFSRACNTCFAGLEILAGDSCMRNSCGPVPFEDGWWGTPQ